MVTGGAGFIGSHLTEELIRRGETVRVLDNLSSGRRENLEQAEQTGKLELTIGDVRDVDTLSALMEGCSRVFHLAASVGVGTVTAHPLESMQNNVEGVQSLFAALHRQSTRPRLIVFSSSEVYGKSAQVPLREETTFEIGPTDVFRWSYATSKILSEYHALCEHAEHGVEVVVVRCFNTSGPRQLPTYGMVVPRFFEQALRGEPITVYGDGTQTRCFSYVGDVVEGVIRLSEAPSAIGQVFNVGSDAETSVLELAHAIRAVTGSSSPIQLTPYRDVFGERFQEVQRRVPDLARLEKVVGFRPRTPLAELLELTYRHHRAISSGTADSSTNGVAAEHDPALPRS